jgi:hypothetical protein
MSRVAIALFVGMVIGVLIASAWGLIYDYQCFQLTGELQGPIPFVLGPIA